MLKKEALKQAIDAIAARDREAGYTLNELFGTGRIDVVHDKEKTSDGGRYALVFDGRTVPIKKINYFNEGAACLEQCLLIQYGEMVRKQALRSSDGAVNYTTAEKTIRLAGLRYLVRYELQRACCPSGDGRAAEIQFREPYCALLEQCDAGLPEDYQITIENEQTLYAGAVDVQTPAAFAIMPLSLNALLQVADLGLTFFSVRFVMRCMRDGTAQNLFVCLVNGLIEGLVYLRFPSVFMVTSIEIKYIASAKDASNQRLAGQAHHRGVGTFLVAGVWLYWKTFRPESREIVLDAELQALGFYPEIGFEQKRLYVYALKRPAGNLLNALVVMLDRSSQVPEDVVQGFLKMIRDRVGFLARRRISEVDRRQALGFIQLCLLSRSRRELAHTAAVELLRHRTRIPEAGTLLGLASQHGRICLVDTTPAAVYPLLVFRDAEMYRHLKGIFHLESANRLKAIDTILDQDGLREHWKSVPASRATFEELAWVHTPGHIRRVQSTVGKALYSFDLDTQTTGASYAAACLAVGGVFSLLDTLWNSPSPRGFAAVRPPGHHAEADRAMGFCLFNNTALGASYLQHALGLKRIMVVDIDAHHGNGTQAAFYQTDAVLFVSLHQFPCFPGSGNFSEIGNGPGEGYSVNIPLDKGMGDREFVQVLVRIAHPLARAYQPDIILVSCGFDLYRHDRLAGLNGTPEGYAMLTHLLCRMADEVCQGRIAFIMEGGYSVQGIEACGSEVLQVLAGRREPDPSRLEKFCSRETPDFAALQKTISIHKKYWPILIR